MQLLFPSTSLLILPSLVLVFFSLCSTWGSNSDRTLQRYTTNLHAMLHSRSQTANSAHTTSPNFHNTRARGRSRHSTLSKMPSFIVDSCRDQGFSLETWDWRRTIAWGRCTPQTIVDQFGIKISGFTPSCEALGHLLKMKKKMMTKIRISHMSNFSCGETKVCNDP